MQGLFPHSDPLIQSWKTDRFGQVAGTVFIHLLRNFAIRGSSAGWDGGKLPMHFRLDSCRRGLRTGLRLENRIAASVQVAESPPK